MMSICDYSRQLYGPVNDHRTTLIIILIMILSHVASANDAVLTLNGGILAPRTDNKCSVEMQREHVKVAFDSNQYTVDATFHFINRGPDTTLTVGFPEVGEGYFSPGDEDMKNKMLGFQAWTDGVETPYTEQPGKVTIKRMNYDGVGAEVLTSDQTTSAQQLMREARAGKYGTVFVDGTWWYTREVLFPKEKNVTCRVRYTAQYLALDGGSSMYANYTYGTGASWGGRIGESVFELSFASDIWLMEWPEIKHPHIRKRLNDTTLQITVTEYEPESDATLKLCLSSRFLPFAYFDDYKYERIKMTDDDFALLSRLQIISLDLILEKCLKTLDEAKESSPPKKELLDQYDILKYNYDKVRNMIR